LRSNTKKLLDRSRIGLGQYNFMARSHTSSTSRSAWLGIISPWNFPWATPLDEVVMALMAGNAVVVKPSELTPLTALKIEDVFKQAQLPEGLVQIVTGDGSTGAALVDAGVNKIMFTGSVNTGKRVAEAAAKHLDARRARARRQRSDDRARRCESRERGARGDLGRLLQFRTGLRLDRTLLRARIDR
jgi:hypothetical protein